MKQTSLIKRDVFPLHDAPYSGQRTVIQTGALVARKVIAEIERRGGEACRQARQCQPALLGRLD